MGVSRAAWSRYSCWHSPDCRTLASMFRRSADVTRKAMTRFLVLVSMSLPPLSHKNSGMVLPGSTPYQNISWKARGYGKSYQNIHNCRRACRERGFGRFRKDCPKRRKRGDRGTDATPAPFAPHSGSQGQTGTELFGGSMTEKNGFMASLSTA